MIGYRCIRTGDEIPSSGFRERKTFSRVGAFIVFLTAAGGAGAGEYWHSYNTSTIYPTYSEAKNALIATNSTTALFKLETSSGSASANQIGDVYGVPPVPPTTDDWYYKQGWTGAQYATEAELVADYEVYVQGTHYTHCGPATFVATSGWTVASNYIGTSKKDQKSGYYYNIFWNSNTQTCTTSTVQAGLTLERFRNVYCESPRYGSVPEQACVNITKGTVFYRPVTPAGECRGNPCDVATGDKIIRETDYVGAGIEFKRAYHSAITHTNTRMGEGWTHSYSSKILVADANYPGVVTDDGYQEPMVYKGFVNGKKTFGATSGSNLWLFRNSASDWWLYAPDQSIRYYDGSGRLVKHRSPEGQETVITRDAQGRIDFVTGPFGHVLDFAYDGNGLIEKIVDPSSGEIEFTYATSVASGRTILSRVTYQDGSYKEYEYELTDAIRDTHVTGITDENDDRFSTYDYNANGLVTLSEHAGGKESISLSYTSTTSQVVEDGGSTTDYVFSTSTQFPRKVLTRTEAGTTRTIAYPTPAQDNRNRPTQITDELGRVSKFTYDNQHRLTATVAFGTSQARTTTYTYLAGYHNRLTKVSTPSVKGSGNREVVTAYDGSGRPTSITVTGFKPNGTAVSRATTLTYNSAGQVLTVNGPRTDVTDVTTFDYYDCTTGDECGQLESITNALSQVTTFDSYDEHGRLLQLTDPNGLEISYAYDLRGRVLTVTETPVSGTPRTTTNTYDDVGQLITVTTPDGLELSYEYDAAHDLVSVTDNFGNRIEYDYDTRGNRTDEDTYDPSATLKRAFDIAYDLRNRVDTINQGGFTTDLVFDALGNLADETDPNSAETEHNYDPLNRLAQTVDALAGETDYAYDVNDNLVSVVAPNGATTTYEYDDLGNRLKEVSPDRGTTTYTHDAAGNVLTATDARGKVTTHTYDVLNRLTLVELDNSDSIAYQYDTGTNAKGRLNKITDSTGQTTWSYNNFGEVTAKSQTIGSVTLTIQYGYDTAGRLTTVTLPSGKVVTYGYSNHLPVSVTVDSTTILSAASYDPFGPVKGWSWGNSTSHSRGFDLRGLMSSQSLVVDTRTLGYDDAGRLITLDDSRHDLGFDYNPLGQLTDFTKTGAAPLPASQDFTYDENGNRESITESSTTYDYYLTSNTNRLTSTTGPAAKSYTYDAAGNVTSDNIHSYGYDDRGRLANVDSGAVTYAHNGQGQRVMKDTGSVTLFAYDEAGQLIGEYDQYGATIQETVWFNGAPVAVLVGSNKYYVHTDHLGTPRAISNGNTVIWRWESDPFGSTAAQEDPDGDSNSFTYNLRFPGQYLDEETGLHYNYFRTYDPSTGRYLESDPIGLGGGLNTYGYVDGNPLGYVDYYGLSGTIVLPRPIVVPRPVPVPGESIDPLIMPMSPADIGYIPLVDIENPYTGEKEQCPRDCKGLLKQIWKHEEKLRQYMNDPLGDDNLGFLYKAVSESRRMKIMDGRIRNLENQIRNFKKQYQECLRQNGMIT